MGLKTFGGIPQLFSFGVTSWVGNFGLGEIGGFSPRTPFFPKVAPTFLSFPEFLISPRKAGGGFPPLYFTYFLGSGVKRASLGFKG